MIIDDADLRSDRSKQSGETLLDMATFTLKDNRYVQDCRLNLAGK